MVIVAGRILVDPARVAEFQAVVVPLARGSRLEEGCLHYSLAVDDPGKGEIVVLERWRDEPTLRRHLATDHVKTFLEAVGPFVRSMEAKLYDAVNEREVMA